MRCKRYKSAPVCWIAGPLPIGTVLLRRCGNERDGLLATRCVLADVPYVIWRPCPLAGDSLGLGLVFRELSKLLHQEDALGAPCLDTVILALHRRALAGRSTARPTARRGRRDRRNAADRRNPSLRNHITACYTGQSGRQALMLSRWWAADAQVERMGARPNRAVVVKTALT